MSATQVFAIVGFPVSHSRSPAMHNRAFAALGLDAVYAPFAVDPKNLGAAIAGMRALGIAGANITLPHKTKVMAMLDYVEPQARAIGAVNTLYWEGKRLCGENTDAPGLARALSEARVPLQGATVTVLGAGGAARAAIVGLAAAGAAAIHVAARRRDAAQALVASLAAPLATSGCAVRAQALDKLEMIFATTDVLVQATSATLGEGESARAFAASLPIAALPDHASVTDLVYKPLHTSVLRVAAARGLRTVDGLGMLLHQGALSFERWTKKQAPLTVMRAALVESTR